MAAPKGNCAFVQLQQRLWEAREPPGPCSRAVWERQLSRASCRVRNAVLRPASATAAVATVARRCLRWPAADSGSVIAAAKLTWQSIIGTELCDRCVMKGRPGSDCLKHACMHTAHRRGDVKRPCQRTLQALALSSVLTTTWPVMAPGAPTNLIVDYTALNTACLPSTDADQPEGCTSQSCCPCTSLQPCAIAAFTACASWLTAGAQQWHQRTREPCCKSSDCQWLDCQCGSAASSKHANTVLPPRREARALTILHF